MICFVLWKINIPQKVPFCSLKICKVDKHLLIPKNWYINRKHTYVKKILQMFFFLIYPYVIFWNKRARYGYPKNQNVKKNKMSKDLLQLSLKEAFEDIFIISYFNCLGKKYLYATIRHIIQFVVYTLKYWIPVRRRPWTDCIRK